jgi:transcriptional regulator with XRE-family HTH domain
MIPERLKDAREQAGFTQRAVAQHLDVTIGSVQAWEYGNANLSLHRAMQLTDLYGVTLEWLAYGDTPPRPEDPRINQIRKIVH